MNSKPSLVDNWLQRLKSRRWAASAILFGVAVVAITQFGEALAFWVRVFAPAADLEVVDLKVVDEPAAIKSFRSTWLNRPAYRLSEAELRSKWKAASDKALARLLDQVAKEFDNDSVVIERWRRNWQQSVPAELTLEPLESGFSIIDVKIRNTSSNTAVLSRLDVVVRPVSYERLGLHCAPQPINPSWEYNLLIEDHDLTRTHKLDLSQGVDPHAADRFLVTLGQGPDPARATYEILLKIRYNRGRLLELRPVRVDVTGPLCGWPIAIDDIRWIEPGIP